MKYIVNLALVLLSLYIRNASNTSFLSGESLFKTKSNSRFPIKESF